MREQGADPQKIKKGTKPQQMQDVIIINGSSGSSSTSSTNTSGTNSTTNTPETVTNSNYNNNNTVEGEWNGILWRLNDDHTAYVPHTQKVGFLPYIYTYISIYIYTHT